MPNGLIDRGEDPFSQEVDHPIGDDLHAGFDISLAAWVVGACRHRGGTVVLQELRIGGIHLPGTVGAADRVRRRGGVILNPPMGRAG